MGVMGGGRGVVGEVNVFLLVVRTDETVAGEERG